MAVWKQPIPTNLLEICKGNALASTVFMILLLRASNKEVTIYPSGFPVLLKRGQSFCGRFELAKFVGMKRSQSNRIWKILEFLEKECNLMSKRKTLQGSIVTILNYDELVKIEQMNEQISGKCVANEEQMKDTYKSIKSNKNEEETPPIVPLKGDDVGKDSLSLSQRDRFNRFWGVYPNKKSKGYAEKVWSKLNPSEQLLETMISKIEQAKTSHEWTKDNGEYIPHPSTWLNAKGWEDEIKTKEEQDDRRFDFLKRDKGLGISHENKSIIS